MPGVVRWVARGGNFVALLSLFLRAIAALTMSPVRAVTIGGSLGIGALAVWLAAEALRRGQSWGWTVMTWVLAVGTFILFYSLSSAGGSANLSVKGFIGVLLLGRLPANSAPLPG